MIRLILCFTILVLLITSETPKQLNIIYILSDDLGYSDVGFTNGNTETPVLNQLASEGVLLTQHYVQQVLHLHVVPS